MHIKQEFRTTSQKRRTKMTEMVHVMEKYNERALPYAKKNIACNLRWRDERSAKPRGMDCISYVMGAQLQLMKWHELYIPLHKGARQEA